MIYIFLAFGGGSEFNGFNKTPQTHVWRIMQAHIDKVNFQSNFLFKSSIRGANTNEPTPLPAMHIPVATPRFLSKYSAITIIDAI